MPIAPISHRFLKGGLTNQKLALLGLFLAAQKQQRPLSLPQLMSLDILGGNNELYGLGNIYDHGRIGDFATRHGMEIVPADTSLEAQPPTGGKQYFDTGARRVALVATRGRRGEPVTDFTIDFFTSLVPLLRHQEPLRRIRQQIFGEQNISVTAQFRIEFDWQFHSHNFLNSSIKQAEDYLLTFDRIAMKIMRSLPETRKLLVLCDETALPIPKSEMQDVCRSRLGLQLFWKSDFLTREEFAGYSNLERSIIDFELALASPVYVGLTRSSFSNQASFERYAARGAPVSTDYIYNNPAETLWRRTDNGGFISPVKATMVAPVEH